MLINLHELDLESPAIKSFDLNNVDVEEMDGVWDLEDPDE